MEEKTRSLESLGIEIFVQSCIHERPQRIKETRDIDEISKRILQHVKTNATFFKCSVPGLYESYRDNAGVLRSDFKLSEILKKCGLGGNFDGLVFEAIDGLIESGKLVFMATSIRKFMNFRDIFFSCEFAHAMKSNYPREEYDILRFYPVEPLSKAEREKRSAIILNVTEHVQIIREKRDRAFKEKFGDRSGEAKIEKEIDRENAQLRRQEYLARMALLGVSKRAEVPDTKA